MKSDLDVQRTHPRALSLLSPGQDGVNHRHLRNILDVNGMNRANRPLGEVAPQGQKRANTGCTQITFILMLH